MNVEAMKRWLEAFEGYRRELNDSQPCDAEKELRQAIEQAEKQEPDKYAMDIECTNCGTKQSGILTVNTTPPQRQPLTDEEILILNNPNWDKGGEEQLIAAPDEEIIEFARAIEAKLKGEA